MGRWEGEREFTKTHSKGPEDYRTKEKVPSTSGMTLSFLNHFENSCQVDPKPRSLKIWQKAIQLT